MTSKDDQGTRVCAVCGCSLPLPSGKGRPQRYCGDACLAAAKAMRIASKKVCKCGECGKEFTVGYSSQREYCSDECARGHKVQLACVRCGKSFMSHKTNARYCGWKCRSAANPNKAYKSQKRIASLGDEWKTAHAAGLAIGRKGATIKRWARYGKFESRMVGSMTYVRMEQVLEFNTARTNRTPFKVRVADDPKEAGTIYAWKHPMTGEIRYVGKAHDIDARLRGYRHKVHSAHLRRWMEKVRRGGMEPVLMVLQECNGHLAEHERWWISHGRACGWNLINKTDGGEGSWDFSDDVKRRLSEKSKTKWQDPEYRKHWAEGMRRLGRTVATAEQIAKREQEGKVRKLVGVAWKAWIEPALRNKAKTRRRPKFSRKIVVEGGVAYIPLAKDMRAIIDADDVMRAKAHRWLLHSSKSGEYVHAATMMTMTDGNTSLVFLGRFIANAQPDEMVRHANRDQLDCRKRNLIVSADPRKVCGDNRTNRVLCGRAA